MTSARVAPLHLQALAWRVRRLNPLWGGVIVLLLVSAVLWTWQLPMASAELEASRQQADALRRQLIRSPAAVAAPAPGQNLAVFRNTLGELSATDTELERLFRIFENLGLAWDQGQYRLTCDGEAALCRLRLQMPLQGPYDRVRALLDHSLRAVPFAAIEELSLRRESVSDEEIQASVVLVLYLSATRRSATAQVQP